MNSNIGRGDIMSSGMTTDTQNTATVYICGCKFTII